MTTAGSAGSLTGSVVATLLLTVLASVASVAVAQSTDIRLYVDRAAPKEKCARSKRVQVVVARYAEDLDWLHYLPFRDVVVYDKGDGSGGFPPGKVPAWVDVVRLPNVGRCDHTYLWHVSTNYDRLADVTLFVPGSVANFKDKWAKLRWVVEHVCMMGDSAFPIDSTFDTPLYASLANYTQHSYVATHLGNAGVNAESTLKKCEHRPYGVFYVKNFGKLDVHDVALKGVFAVSRQHVQQQPRSRYLKLLEYLDDHSNPEAGHYMERSWLAVFHPIPDWCKSMPTGDWGGSWSVYWFVLGAFLALVCMTATMLRRKKIL
jgi:hypothetical protein